MRFLPALAGLCLCAVCLSAAAATPASNQPPEWRDWSPSVFEQAKKENKFVLLDLEAVWCHWCHVMDETTYRDPAVTALLKSRYITVRVDQDSRPDISNRYEDYGWPATVVFNAGGGEIVKRSGYLPPRQMESILRAIIADPTPGPSVEPETRPDFSHGPALTPAQKTELTSDFFAGYDAKQGAWGFQQKYLDGQSEEFAMTLAVAGDARAEKMARQTLRAEMRLLDPAWGGVYQYSTGGAWNEPHFEKIMATQSVNLRMFSLGYALWREPEFLRAAQSIHGYLRNFLTSPNGAFYTSQDADLVAGEHSARYFQLPDAARRKLGIPRIDRHIYSRENGWAISALAALYAAGGDPAILHEAETAARWIEAHRALPGGGFRHDENDSAGPYLGDTLAMGRAFLDLYSVTGEPHWLLGAEAACQFVRVNFSASSGPGFVTSRPPTHKAPADKTWMPQPERDENISLARFANLLHRYTGESVYRGVAEKALGYVAAPEIASDFPTAGPLLAERELKSEPLRITVVGRREDPHAQALLRAALAYPKIYKATLFLDRREGPAPDKTVYPDLDRAAAFVCSGTRCSRPVFTAETMKERVEHFAR